jgi:hypothetical protein
VEPGKSGEILSTTNDFLSEDSTAWLVNQHLAMDKPSINADVEQSRKILTQNSS